MDGIIYRVYNKINGKSYIGQTIQSFEARRHSHYKSSNSTKCSSYNSHFCHALRKYKPEDFIWIIIIGDIAPEELDWYERFYVVYYSGFSKFGYNSDSGGKRGKILSNETKEKMSKSKRGKVKPESFGKNMTGDKNPMFGKKRPDLAERNRQRAGISLSEEHKHKLLESLKGKDAPNKGKRFSDETRRKMSISGKGKNIGKKRPYLSERNRLNKGKKLTEDQKEKRAIRAGAKQFNVYDCATGNLIGTWINMHKCAEDLVLCRKSIMNRLNDMSLLPYKGYIFKYVETLSESVLQE